LSDPTRGYPVVVPYLLYRDPAAPSAWIGDVLGFREVPRFTGSGGGLVGHIELERDGTILMLAPIGDTCDETSLTLVFVDAACARRQEAAAYPWSEGEKAAIEGKFTDAVVGSPSTVCRGLQELVDRQEPDELMITTQVHGKDDRRRSYELIAAIGDRLNRHP
jgi:alkanesulfonate monooxygenase SsuD/methylene tetrahydromethanopterin reductase-like flavin-dependent oxidoreductase (luciferase family)